MAARAECRLITATHNLLKLHRHRTALGHQLSASVAPSPPSPLFAPRTAPGQPPAFFPTTSALCDTLVSTAVHTFAGALGRCGATGAAATTSLLRWHSVS